MAPPSFHLPVVISFGFLSFCVARDAPRVSHMINKASTTDFIPVLWLLLLMNFIHGPTKLSRLTLHLRAASLPE